MVAVLHAGIIPHAGIFTKHSHTPSRLCSAFASSRRLCCSFRRIVRQPAAAVEAPSAPASATPSSAAYCTPEELRAQLIQKGWQRAWLDGIQERQSKGEFTTTLERAERLTSYLESLGIPNQSVCNMASMCPKILGVEQSQAKGIVEILSGRGLNGEEIAGVLQRHPKLLTFSIVGKGALENGRMRAEAGKDNAGRVWVNLFREGAYRKNPPQ